MAPATVPMLRACSLAVLLCLLASGCDASTGQAPKQVNSTDVSPLASPSALFTPKPVMNVDRPAKNWFQAACDLPLNHLRWTRRGLVPGVSPDVPMVPREPNFFGGFIGQNHAGPSRYVQEVPIVFYGPGMVDSKGWVDPAEETTLADIAPTTARLLDTPLPTAVGRSIPEVVEALKPNTRPKLIVTVVLDGGGIDVLDAWPEAYPNLTRMMRGGVSIENALVGLSPSSTPQAHATIGTGAFPRQHGITGINMRVGTEMKSPFANSSAANMRLPSLADTYDRSTNNAAKVGMISFSSWHLGMLGHGALFPGGDKDIEALVDSERFRTNPDYYALPGYLRQTGDLRRDKRLVDDDDGKIDGKWMGFESLDDPDQRRSSPVWILHQTDLIKAIISRERFGADNVPDLFYTNYKQLDLVGHRFNMLYPETQATLRYTDAALGKLESFLNREIGRGSWVMIVTADHGQAPLAEVAQAWPISKQELDRDIERHFDMKLPLMFQLTHSSGYWLNQDLDDVGRFARELANFLINYRLKDNAARREIPPAYRDRLEEPILAAAFPSQEMDRIWKCGLSKRGR
jgi:Type I phosphodiesterase / nucleotide pyrophosphatase